MDLKSQKIIVVGGGSGMGFAIARAAAAAGADVVLGGRSLEKLQRASESLGPHASAAAIDMTDPASVAVFFKAQGKVDHLVITASSVKTGSIHDLAFTDALASMQSKFWGPYLCARHAQLNPKGSLTLFSGILSRKPAPGLAALAGINAAVEGLGRALALELAPVRVNVISPGLTDTGVYDSMPTEKRKAFFEGTARSLPTGRIGQPQDIAAAALMLMTNGFVTGVTLDVDGGGSLGATLPH
jgi:NAD(P)-dependent dehydrogenase (short-subunit alcohol dehydrogenase family)